MSKLLQEAIADAKAVRDMAIQNAKASLEETFNREVVGIFQNKIKEELDSTEEIDESLKSSGIGGKANNTNPTAKKPSKQEKTKKEPQKYEKFFEETEEVAETVTPEGGPESVDAKLDNEGDDAISNDELEEILQQLENDVAGDENSPAPAAPAAPVDPNAPVAQAPAPAAPIVPPASAPVPPAPVDPTAPVVPPAAPAPVDATAPATETDPNAVSQPPVAEDENLEEISLDELLSELSDESLEEAKKKDDDEKHDKEDDDEEDDDKPAFLKKENAELKSQLSEHVRVIEYLRGQINEINLLNAKLLYTNKLFKKHALSNEQKLKIVEKFDLASTVREVKYAYTILAESLNSGVSTVKKSNTVVKNITEGLASKTVASTKPAKDVIVENTNELASRFKTLAGIKK